MDSRYPVIRLVAALAIMTIGGAAMYSAIVALKPIEVEFGVSRAAASLPYMAVMVGFGVGGVFMGRISDRYGPMPVVFAGGLALGLGYWLGAGAQAHWQVAMAQGVLIGLFGASTTMAPMVADISHWFDRRRGLAVGIVISGSYVAGAVWPPILQEFVDSADWRAMYRFLAMFSIIVVPALGCLLYRRTPHAGMTGDDGTARFVRPLGLAPPTLQTLLCAAGVGCCVAMSMPQVHIVAYASDLGFEASDGALMLSLMLGFGIVSRLGSGWISDRIGGLRTMALGSGLQAGALVLFLPADSLVLLYVVSALFGLSQGGIVPSYTIIVRTYFPPGEAGWRIGAALLFTMIGMALGGWMAGQIFDMTGSYRLAFMNAIAFNVLHLALAATLVRRARAEPRTV